MPVRAGDMPAMLKVSDDPYEARAEALMRWWAGDGAAPVLACDADALVMARAAGPRSLLDLAQRDDAEATRILCHVARRLHARRGPLPPGLVPLKEWFTPLLTLGPVQDGLLARAAGIARELLATPRDVVPLHGDLHHENVLDFSIDGTGDNTWLAIDPKGLTGERTFEYAILFCDPDIGRPEVVIARQPENFARRLAIVCAEAGLERDHLLRWILAWCGLSWMWAVEDGSDAPVERQIAAFAAARLDG
jgi:streptomycin 6-kinase